MLELIAIILILGATSLVVMAKGGNADTSLTLLTIVFIVFLFVKRTRKKTYPHSDGY